MSGTIRLPPEVDELFSYSDGEGLLEPEDLEEAGFEYLEDDGSLELWIKNDIMIKYKPEEQFVEDYDDI